MRHQKWGNLQKLDYQIAPIWVIAWIIIFLLIILCTIFTPVGDVITIVKLSGIILCLFYVAYTFPRDYLLLLAMLTTCLADIVLANNNTSTLGVLIFLITQIIHLCRLDGIRLKIPIIIWTTCAFTTIILDYIFQIVPLLFVVCSFYAITLIFNIIASVFWRKRDPKSLRSLFAILGFGLFACCDFCTGISYLSLVDVINASCYAPANILVWLFYYPSQILVSNTGSIDPPKFSFGTSRPHQ